MVLQSQFETQTHHGTRAWTPTYAQETDLCCMRPSMWRCDHDLRPGAFMVSEDGFFTSEQKTDLCFFEYVSVVLQSQLEAWRTGFQKQETDLCYFEPVQVSLQS